MITANLVWMRRDLRILDNQALISASQNADAVVVVFYLTPQQWAQHQRSHRQLDIIRRRIAQLQAQLAQKNIPLLCRTVDRYRDIAHDLTEICQQMQIQSVYCEAETGLDETRRDNQVAQALQQSGIAFRRVGWPTVMPPGSVVNGEGLSYKVFTAFKRCWLRSIKAEQLTPQAAVSDRMVSLHNIPESTADWRFLSADVQTCAYAVDDGTIQGLLSQFIQERLNNYSTLRDVPAEQGTSQLSHCLATGMLSPRQVIAALISRSDSASPTDSYAQDPFVGQLIWREFFHHLLWHYPRLCKREAFLQWTEKVGWNACEDSFSRWKAGMTGFPIVDAAMRQLQREGWMHNRLRMVVASFLSKDLMIDWRKGEDWFMQQLVDGDFALNNGGWQWCASTGTDAQPYFRVFNPTLQSRRFDPVGDYIRRWLPELASVTDKGIHTPHSWAEQQGERLDYPMPMVDHRQAKAEAIEAFKKARASA